MNTRLIITLFPLFLITIGNLSAENDLSGVNKILMPAGKTINFDNINKDSEEPVLTIKSFNLPKASKALNLADEPIVTRSSGTNIYRKAAPSVVKIINDQSEGTGSFISSNGHIITNWHVIEGWSTVGVVLYENRDEENPPYILADVIKIKPKSDLALLKIQKKARIRNFLQLGVIPDVGTQVHAIGHSEGYDWTYTQGYISGLRNNYTWAYKDSAHTASVIQTQTPINPGNSGGPLLNASGEIVGINSFMSQGENLNFAVSAQEVKNFIESNDDDFGPIAPPYAYIGSLDVNEDGRDDTWIWDVNEDEIPDIVATDTNGDQIPDQYELIRFVDNCILGMMCEEEMEVFGFITIQEIYGNNEVVWYIDEDGDGEPDSGGIDYNRDGEPDFIRPF